MSDGNQIRLSKKQVEQIKGYARDEAKLKRAVAGIVTRKRRSPKARAMASGDSFALRCNVFNAIWARIPKHHRDKAFEIICNKFHYCSSRKDFGWLLSVIGPLTALVSTAAVPIALWVYVLCYRCLDELCSCIETGFPIKGMPSIFSKIAGKSA